MSHVNLTVSIVLYSLQVVMLAAYAARIRAVGRARQRRLETGEGQLLGTTLMEAGYWFFKPIIALFLALRVTPNMITMGSLVPALGAGVALALGQFGIGSALAVAAGLCDLFDGVLARHLGTTSDAGEVADAAADRYTEYFVLGGIAVHYGAHWPLHLLALAAILGSFMISYSTAKAEALSLPPPRGMMRRAERAYYIAFGAAAVPVLGHFLSPELAARIEIRELPLLIPLALVAVLGNITAVVRFIKIARLARERDRRPAGSAPAPGGIAAPASQQATAH